MLDEKEDFNSKKDDESVQTIRKLSRNRQNKVNTKSSKVRISKKHK